MSEPLKPGPSQIDSVVNVDRMDTLDRQKLDPRVKLRLLAEETKVQYGRDPRTGGFAIVARPRALLQLMIDESAPGHSEIRLERPVIAGSKGGDVIGWWQDIPVIVRCNVVDDRVWCVRTDKIPESTMLDRRRAGELRLAAHAGRLESLRGG